MYKFTAVINSEGIYPLLPQITAQKECVALRPQNTAQSAGGALRMIHIQKMKPEYSEILIF